MKSDTRKNTTDPWVTHVRDSWLVRFGGDSRDSTPTTNEMVRQLDNYGWH